MNTAHILTSILLFMLVITLLAVVAKPTLFKASRKKILTGVIIALITLCGFFSITGIHQAWNSFKQQVAQPILSFNGLRPTLEIKEKAEKTPIAFDEERRNDNSFANGIEKIIQEGANGEETSVYTAAYINGKELGRVLKDKSITVAPTKRIVVVGTYTAPVVQSALPRPRIYEPDRRLGDEIVRQKTIRRGQCLASIPPWIDPSTQCNNL